MKRIILLMTICLLSLASFAQEFQQPKHEISIWGAGGISTLNFDPSVGEYTPGFGYLGGLGYNYFFNYNWSLGLGAEFSVLNSAVKFNNFTDRYNVSPSWPQATGTYIDLSLEGTGFKQKYTGYYVNIPLMAKYQTDVWKEHKFYAAGGFKLGIPVSDPKYSHEGILVAKGQERDLDGTPHTKDLYTNLHEFREYKDGAKGNFDLDLSYILSLEAGMKWKLNTRNNLFLYTGLFFDYGFNDVRKGSTDNKLLADYDAQGRNVVINNILYSNNVNYPTVDKVNTISAGLKVQLAFGLKPYVGKKAKVIHEAAKPLTADDIDEIVTRNTQDLIKNQKEGVKEIKDLINDLFKKEAKEVEEGYRLQTVWGFNLDKTDVLSSMISILDENLSVLKSHPEVRVNLVGNTDDIASDAYNIGLGLRRAQVIKDWLVNRGISESRLSVSSNGYRNPAIPNLDDANRKYNRRVEFIVVK